MSIRFALILFILLPGYLLPAQDAESLLKSVRQNMDKISRFEADASVKVAVDFIDIKDRKVKVRFESPDTFSFDVEGLALLPKNGMQMDFLKLLNAKYTSIFIGEEAINNSKTQIVKIIPEAENSDIVLAQLWIDPNTYRIMRMKTFTRQSGSYLIDFEYNNNIRPLPDRVTVRFDISNMSVPVKMMSEMMGKGISKPDSLPTKAKVIVQYSNYKIVYK